MSSSNLLKGFGAGADVASQLATDKAIRRKSTGTIRGFDITDGELYEGPLENGTQNIGHSLRRTPSGAMALLSPAAAEFRVLSTTAQSIEVWASGDIANVVLWIV